MRSFATIVDTEAVLQEALLRVWQTAPRVQPDGRPDSLLRYALRVTRNAAVDEARRARVRPIDPALVEAALPPVEPALPDPALRRALERCRRALKGPPRAAFDARLEARGGVHDRELAAAVDMRPNTFLKNVGRARKLLAACLRRAGVVLEAPWTT